MEQQLPNCFAKLWDPKEPKCGGGLDPTYEDPITRSRVRNQCPVFSACGARVQAARMQPQLIPASQVARTPTQETPYSPYGQSHQVQIQELQKQIQQLQNIIQQQNTQLSQRVPPMPYQGAMHPVHVVQEYRMPDYLTVPEPKANNSVWTILGRSMMRSAFKSIGHTMAAFWDVTPLGDDNEGK